jgi:hypothetical protein
LEVSAVHPTGTFNGTTPASLQVKKDGLAFLQGDVLEYNGMTLLVDSVVSDTEVKCLLIGSADVEIPDDTALSNAGNSSME